MRKLLDIQYERKNVWITVPILWLAIAYHNLLFFIGRNIFACGKRPINYFCEYNYTTYATRKNVHSIWSARKFFYMTNFYMNIFLDEKNKLQCIHCSYIHTEIIEWLSTAPLLCLSYWNRSMLSILVYNRLSCRTLRSLDLLQLLQRGEMASVSFYSVAISPFCISWRRSKDRNVLQESLLYTTAICSI